VHVGDLECPYEWPKGLVLVFPTGLLLSYEKVGGSCVSLAYGARVVMCLSTVQTLMCSGICLSTFISQKRAPPSDAGGESCEQAACLVAVMSAQVSAVQIAGLPILKGPPELCASTNCVSLASGCPFMAC